MESDDSRTHSVFSKIECILVECFPKDSFVKLAIIMATSDDDWLFYDFGKKKERYNSNYVDSHIIINRIPVSILAGKW